MLLTVVQQTLTGFDPGGGTPDEQVTHLFERIQPRRPDLLLLNGCQGWEEKGHRLLVRAKQELELCATPLGESFSGRHTVILFRPETLGDWIAFDSMLSKQTYNGYCYAAFDVGLVHPLGVVCFSLHPYAAQAAQTEVGILAACGYQRGRFAIAAGAGVYAPAHPENPEPTWMTMRPYEVGVRRLLPTDPSQDETRPNRSAARAFLSHGYVDTGWHTADRLESSELLQHTSRFDRDDWIMVSEPLKSTVTDYTTLWEPPKVFSHAGVMITMDTELSAKADQRSR